jgi:hypothetical protein
MSRAGQMHGDFIPGGAKVIHGKILPPLARRCEMLIEMGRRRDVLTKLGDRDGLLALADEYQAIQHDSAWRIARDIKKYCEGKWPHS